MTDKLESVFEQFKLLIQKIMPYKCACGNTLQKMVSYSLRFKISDHSYFIKEGEQLKEIFEYRYKLYYQCDELSGNDKYIGDPWSHGFSTVAEAAENLKGYLSNDK